MNAESPVAQAVREERETVERYLRDLASRESDAMVSFVLSLAAEHIRRGLHEAIDRAEAGDTSNVVPFR